MFSWSWLLCWEALFSIRLEPTLELLASFIADPIPFAEFLPVLPKRERSEILRQRGT